MERWPEFEPERLEVALLRVDLQEQRLLASGDHQGVVNHLLRSASAACLADREDDAVRFIARAAGRTMEWVRAARAAKTKPSTFADLAFTRGWLAAAIAPPADLAEPARNLLAMTGWQPAGSAHNARAVAAVLSGDLAAAQASLALCDLSDPGLGAPLKRFLTALLAADEPAMKKAATAWLQEKMDATMTHEWGAYNEVPIEVSGALALAGRNGSPVRLTSNRVLTELRA
jgi:hypothetical protein